MKFSLTIILLIISLIIFSRFHQTNEINSVKLNETKETSKILNSSNTQLRLTRNNPPKHTTKINSQDVKLPPEEKSINDITNSSVSVSEEAPLESETEAIMNKYLSASPITSPVAISNHADFFKSKYRGVFKLKAGDTHQIDLALNISFKDNRPTGDFFISFTREDGSKYHQIMFQREIIERRFFQGTNPNILFLKLNSREFLSIDLGTSPITAKFYTKYPALIGEIVLHKTNILP